MAIVKRGTTYSVVISRGRDPKTGKKKQEWYSGFPDPKTAKAEEERIKTEMRQGTWIKPDRQTVGEYFDEWLETVDVRGSTKDTYIWAVNILKKSFGEIPLHQLSADPIDRHFIGQRKEREKGLRLEKLRQKKEAEAIQNGEKLTPELRKKIKVLSTKSIRYQYNVLNIALNTAVKKRKIPWNPCAAIYPPEVEEYKPKVYNEEQIQAAIMGARNTKLFLPVVLGLTCGMRRGEICGLRWQDVDLDSQELHIHFSLDRVEALEEQLKESVEETPSDSDAKKRKIKTELDLLPVKTHRSERPIKLPEIAVTALRIEKAKQEAFKNKADSLYVDRDFCWAWEDGRPHDPDYLYKEFKKLMKKIGLPVIRTHDMRHSHATYLRDNEVDMHTISERLGHFSSSFTHKEYAHPTAKTQNKAANTMDALFKPKE